MSPRNTSATKIVATLGPASRKEHVIAELIRAGVDVFRFNFSHGEAEQHAETAALVRKLAADLDQPVGILQDLQGPKIRVGDLPGDGVRLLNGSQISLCSGEGNPAAGVIPTTYEQLADDAHEGDRILLNDGAMELQVVATTACEVRCRVVRGGILTSHKGINLPGVSVSVPAITEKDAADMKTGTEIGVDFVAMSFVRTGDDLNIGRKVLEQLGSDAPLIAKLEKPDAIARLDEVLRASNGVMVARGDLGVEMSPEQVPIIQKTVLERALALGVPSITATQMLETMISSPRPTRAEASDVANAILDGTDAVMLSGETAVGQYPVEAVQMMQRIALETERSGRRHVRVARESTGPVHALSNAARTLADELPQVCAVVPLSNSGYTARLISGSRVETPIWAYTYSKRVLHKLSLWWGVRPFLMPKYETIEESIRWVEHDLLQRGYVTAGEMFVVTGGMPIPGPTRTNFLKLHTVGTPA